MPATHFVLSLLLLAISFLSYYINVVIHAVFAGLLPCIFHICACALAVDIVPCQ